MSDEQENSRSYTNMAWNSLYDAVDHDYFRSQDAELIYTVLKERLQPRPFYDYLKRYIFVKSGMIGSSHAVPLKEYQDYLIAEFRKNNTPASFTPGSTKISAITKNWLMQQTVKRSAVLLMGFGLNMSPQEVNELLEKGLHEPSLNLQSPMEAVCSFCYSHGLSFDHYQRLWDEYSRMAEENAAHPVPVKDLGSFSLNLQTEEELLQYLHSLLSKEGKTLSERRTRKLFLKMYDTARDLIAKDRNETEAFENSSEVREARDRCSRSDKLYDFEKRERLDHLRSQRKQYTREDISEADLEQVLCASVPTDRHGNLVPEKKSLLSQQFAGKRFSRRHIWSILNGAEEPDRFDLITLEFLIFAEQVDKIPNAKKRYSTFIEKMNEILKYCGMGPLYVAHPYECFILMCILSEDPLGTYADVWEMSYDTEE